MIAICENLTGKNLQYTYTDTNRSGDHIWYVSDVKKFQSHFPKWKYKYNIQDILEDIYQAQSSRLYKN